VSFFDFSLPLSEALIWSAEVSISTNVVFHMQEGDEAQNRAQSGYEAREARENCEAGEENQGERP